MEREREREREKEREIEGERKRERPPLKKTNLTPLFTNKNVLHASESI